jgi:hypothetical protein
MHDSDRQQLWWYPAWGAPYPVPAAPQPEGDRRPVLDQGLRTMITVVLATFTLRMLAAVIGAVVGWGIDPRATYSQRIGYSLDTLGGFGDGEGILLLVAAVALLLWLQAHRRSREAPWLRPRTPPIGLAWWTAVLLVLSVLGSLTNALGIVMVNDGYVSTRVEWDVYISTGGFLVTYALLGVGLLVVVLRSAGAWTPRRMPSRRG